MKEIALEERTEETVRIYFEKAKQPEIRRMLPQKAQTVEEALEDYKETLLPSATSFGRTIVVDGKYVGDVWCYCIDKEDTPNAMLSYCVFEKNLWNAGVATKGIALFLDLLREKIALETIGAFTYADNIASRKVLEKNGFILEESFVENGRESVYYQRILN